MISDSLLERLKTAEPSLETITQSWLNGQYDARFSSLEALSRTEDFWKRPDQHLILKELQHVRTLQESYRALTHAHAELKELVVLFQDDSGELEKLAIEIARHLKQVGRFKVSLLLDGPDDEKQCFININSGAGGTESQDWAEMLLRMYVRFCEREKLNATIMDYQPGETAGIKSATLFVRGKYAYGLLRPEQGIHRLVRISPYDANKRRHTSFAAVFVIPEEPEVSIAIDPKDLRIDTYRAGGAGGQHVNKTDSAVRITHLPTNIVVQCQNERSQSQNKEMAMKMLMAKLVQKERDEAKAKLESVERKSIEWGSQIRSYVLHPYKMVKDHRTEFESPQPDLVLDGELMDFIEAYLIQNKKGLPT